VLFEQMDDLTIVLVVDNCSDQPAEEVLQPLLRKHSDRLRVVRNRLNIGLVANILRCLETADSPYVWILGDDDVPTPGCIAAIHKNIQAQPDACFWKFSSLLFPYKNALKVRSATEFLDEVGSLPMALWISNGVFNRSEMTARFNIASHWASSSAPHLILVLLALQEGKQAVISSDSIVEFKAPTQDQSYDRATVFAGLPLLLQIPADWNTKKTLGRLIGQMFSSPESLALWVSQTSDDSWSAEEKTYHYRSLGNAIYRSFFGLEVRWKYAVLERFLWTVKILTRLDRRFTGGRLLSRSGLSQPAKLARM
jgi:glycosyltransferase involved in cell wall biosynthesis